MPRRRKIMCPQNQASQQKVPFFGPKNVCPFKILDLTLITVSIWCFSDLYIYVQWITTSISFYKWHQFQCFRLASAIGHLPIQIENGRFWVKSRAKNGLLKFQYGLNGRWFSLHLGQLNVRIVIHCTHKFSFEAISIKSLTEVQSSECWVNFYFNLNLKI